VSVSFQVTFDEASPLVLAGFWKVDLGYRDDNPPPGFASWEEALRNVPE